MSDYRNYKEEWKHNTINKYMDNKNYAKDLYSELSEKRDKENPPKVDFDMEEHAKQFQEVQKEIREIQKDANKLTYTAPDGTVYKGFVNIIQAARRGFITSEILDTTKFANIYARLTQAYAQSKRIAEDQLDEPLRSGIRQREYEKQDLEYNQKAGNIDQLPLVPTR